MSRLISWNNTLLYDLTGKPVGTASIGEDITERTQSQEALRRREEKFRQLAENVRAVFRMMNAECTEMIYASPGYEQIWGRSCESLYQNPMSWLEAVVPEDRETATAAVDKQLRGELAESEYRIRTPDGCEKWIVDCWSTIRDHLAKIIRIVASVVTPKAANGGHLKTGQ